MVVFSEEMRKKIKNRKKTGIVIMSISFSLLISVSILLCCFAKYENYLIFEIFAIISTILGGWIAIAIWGTLVKPAKKELDFLSNLDIAEEKIINAKAKIGNVVTLKNGMTFLSLSLDLQEGTRVLLKKEENYLIEEGEVYTFVVKDGFVVNYEKIG